ncbi:hypothetical protein [Cyanothece sp. BG0011]|uniref:hypothetical protein n=1 Tax=Cyanothece sp. BG0011 TaxID=2082950 RepID=UPI0018E569A0|nr:hypothetical protein [Cyanothece sp. BG0011]
MKLILPSGSLDKLPIYAALGVAEIWRYDGQVLRFYGLNEESKSYQEISQSLAFPWLDISLIPQWLEQRLIIGETAVLKQVRQWAIEQKKYNI